MNSSVNSSQLKYYSEHPKFTVAVDCAIFGFSNGSLKLLIHKRPYNPGKGEASLIGGFVEQDESVEDAARRVLTEFTGISDIYMRQLGAFGDVDRDPGDRVISVAFYALVNVEKYKEENILKKAEWVDVDSKPHLCFDHDVMVAQSLAKMRRHIFVDPIGSNLLPDYFTLTQLQVLYESVLGHPIDKRNFRRSILERNVLIKTDKIDKITSKRGAALYQFPNKNND